MKKILCSLLSGIILLTSSGMAFARPSARPAIRPAVRPSVRPDVRPSVKPSVKPEVKPSVSPSTPSNSGGIRPWWWFWGHNNQTIYYCTKCNCKNLKTGWFSDVCKNCNHKERDHVRK